MPHHSLLSLTVSSGRHFPSLHLDFSDRLNVLIGTRGMGKTGILHSILYALGGPLPPSYAAFTPKYDEYMRENLGAGTLALRTRSQHGAIYTLKRAYGEPAPRVYAEDGSLANVTLSGELFGVDAYAQGSLEVIGRTPAAQLELIDQRALADAKDVAGSIAEVERLLSRNAAERTRLAGEVADDEARAVELPQVAEALKALQLPGGEDPAIVARASEHKMHRGRERLAMGELTKGVDSARAGLDAWAASALAQLGAGVSGELERGPHPPSAEVFRRAHETVHRAAGSLEGAAGTLRQALSTAHAALETHARELAAIHAAQDEAYHAIVVRQDADRDRAAERERLHRRFEELSAIAKRLGDRRRELAERVQERERLSDERAALHARLWSARDRVAKRYTAALRDEVRVEVEQAGDVQAYRALLGAMTRGFRDEFLAGVAGAVRPRALLAAVEADDVAVIERVDPSATGKTARAAKLLAALRGSDQLHALETVTLGDKPRIGLKVEGAHPPSDEVSIGQRCTCILPIILLHSVSVLLLDQPEDHLDNSYVYDVLIPTLLEQKPDRQIVIVTHNPNIPVLADAERIFALAGGRWSGRLDAAGNVDEMRPWVERYLEGGREAFRRRAQRYGHLPSEGAAGARP